MSSYETHIGKVSKSAFAIGDNVRVDGTFDQRARDDMADALRELLGIVSNYRDPAAAEVMDLVLSATREIGADKPQKEVFRRLSDATRKMVDRLGPGIIEAGALAEAVARISDLIRHL
ncbi:MAG TPA: hypothetical protein VHZ03_04370 [Trebonia sp.]|jgi:hypothetical protein|nr:hypothetical protein [Trebonia sp.]